MTWRFLMVWYNLSPWTLELSRVVRSLEATVFLPLGYMAYRRKASKFDENAFLKKESKLIQFCLDISCLEQLLIVRTCTIHRLAHLL